MASTINVPSVCIPRVHSSMNGEGVAQVFNEVFGQDCVHHVDMVQREDRKTGYPFFIAYVHFDVIRDVEAFEQCGGTQFLEKINADKEVRLVYRDPWFWKVRRNTKTKHVRRGPRILSDEDTEEFMAHQKKVLESRRKFNEGKQQEGASIRWRSTHCEGAMVSQHCGCQQAMSTTTHMLHTTKKHT